MGDATDPRFVRSRAAILDAARELLLAKGPSAVTHQQIAEHAGIGRATVYRHWPRTDQLLAEAMATVPMPFFDEPTSPYRDWLTSQLTAIAHQLEHDDVLAVTTTLAGSALWDPAMDARRAGFAEILTARLAAALQDAEQRKELAPRTTTGTAAAMAIGPIYYRATIERAPADAELIEQCVASSGDWTAP
ncbi:MAG: TetR/AcrR family transcriptional regulator [Actinobacteria bacterium]|nr:TetR/AcrR family transcriptional regulator [Actinomycetota bacterium]